MTYALQHDTTELVDADVSAEITLIEAMEAIDKALARTIDFIMFVNPLYIPNWHHCYIGYYVDCYIVGRIKRLIIEVPPRHGKSEIVSRSLPARLLGRDPSKRVCLASYSMDLASKMNVSAQRIIESNYYRELYPATQVDNKSLTIDKDGKNYAKNKSETEIVGHPGGIKAVGVGGAVTGFGFTDIIIDDPHKDRAEADSPLMRERAWDWWTGTISTRMEKNAGVIVCQTRWHEDDLVGKLLAKAKSDPKADQFVRITLPALRENYDDPDDPRLLEEPLWPEKYDTTFLEQRKAAGSRDFYSLYQQSPFTEGGNIVEAGWWVKYEPYQLPRKFNRIIISVDATFKEVSDADYAVIQTWGVDGPRKYLLRQLRKKMGYVKTVKFLKLMIDLYPNYDSILVEDKANGSAVIDTFKQNYSNIIAVEPLGSKEARAYAASPQIEGGSVYLPKNAPWLDEYLDEWKKFPSGSHDDQIDATSQALLYIERDKGRISGLLTMERG